VTPYAPPLTDIRFNLETFGYDKLAAIEAYADYDLDTTMDLLESYSTFCTEVLKPLSPVGDKQGVKYSSEDHSVTMPDGFADAYKQFCENGFTSIASPAEHGGMGAPFTIPTMAGEILISCNKSFSMCPGLTGGLIEALEAHGSDELKEQFLEKMITGEWTGTMCLTEPHCGTDLGLLTTRAEPEGDHYVLNGTKVWITFGEHDMADNIIHLVLARLPDAPAGIRGISTFLVPKFNLDGTRNGIYCGGTDHKVGIHASPTCVMNLEGAKGFLVGEPGRGMKSMFTMMNAARLHVGIEGVALAEAAYQAALAFAKDRRQGKALDAAKREDGQVADNILVHADVRRMLLNIKSTTEGLRGLATWLSMNIDLAHHSDDEAVRERADDMVALLTPIIKSYGSERGFLNVSEAMQVMGGAGYTTDWPVEQYLRDVRIAMIYEGTNHIQALDLVGRKLPMHNGRLMQGFADEITQIIRATKGNEALAPVREALKGASKKLTETTMWLAGNAMADAEIVGATASNYLNQFALTSLAYIWLRQLHAVQGLDDSSELKRSKMQTGRFFFESVLPEADCYATKVLAGKGSVADIDVDLL
jgi:alkylation response protein AidB-like acyl-CoA dehydrogenase